MVELSNNSFIHFTFHFQYANMQKSINNQQNSCAVLNAPNAVYICAQCRQKFEKIYELRQHYSTNHKGPTCYEIHDGNCRDIN